MILIRRAWLLAFSLGLVTLFFLLNWIRPTPRQPATRPYIYGSNGTLYNPSMFHPGTPVPGHNYTLHLVVGRLTREDIGWIAKELPTLPHTVYTVDSPSSTLPANKGHEAMVYLSYIIAHYDELPDVVLFMHPHRVAWHNNVLLDVSAVTTIQMLSTENVVRHGYFNTRCHLDPGCPDWLHVDRPRRDWDPVHKPEEPFLTAAVFHELHGDAVEVPASISQPCCAQFAVSRERIRGRPRDEYVRYRDWILQTDLDDDKSGRLLEYSWQYIFTGQWDWCPSQHRCYCDGYGVCFRGEDGLREWLAILRAKEEIDDRLKEMWKAELRSGKEYRTLLTASRTYARTLVAMKEEAIRRGQDPRIRAEECGREWVEGAGV